MKRRVLNWLFGTDNVEKYMDLLYKNLNHSKECRELIDKHLETLKSQQEDLNNIRKLIKICENHGINIDKEVKEIKL